MKRFTLCCTAALAFLAGLTACDSETIVGPDLSTPTDLVAADGQAIAADTEARSTIRSERRAPDLESGKKVLEEQIALISDWVGDFVAAGSLSKSIGISLTVDLDGATSALVRGSIRDTINRMEDFVGRLCGIGTTPLCGIGTTPNGPVASAESELLISSAQTVIAQLKNT